MRKSGKRTVSTAQLSLILLGTCASLATIVSFYLTHGLHSFEQYNPIVQSLGTFLRTAALDLDQIYPRQEPIPNPEPANGYDTFSACLLVMDDNHRLVEWLAYHYHVLPLRYLVVTVDPRSKTSPSIILNRWRRQGMVIVEWTDMDYWKKGAVLKPIPDSANLQTKRDRHRGRQKYFYRQCLIHMQKHNRTWVSLHDTDEYLVYNHAGGDKFEAWEQVQQRRHEASRLTRKTTRIRPSQTPPTTALEGGMIQYIRQEQAAGLSYYQSPCIGIPRLQFGAVESTTDQVQNQVPPEFQNAVWDLDTLRWRKHAPRNDFVKNALGKVIIDVSRVDVTQSPPFMSLHRPIKSICSAPWHNDWDSGLRINHYLGSWESYSFRDDARRGFERSREQWEYKSSTNADATDDNIRPWIQGFARHNNAKALLQGAGLPAGYRVKNESAWNLLPDKLETILSTNVTVANDNKMVAFDAFVREKYKNG